MIKIRRIVEFCRLSIKLLAFWLTRLTFTEIYNGQYFLFLYVYRLPQCTDSLGVELKLPTSFDVCFRRGFESRSVQSRGLDVLDLTLKEGHFEDVKTTQLFLYPRL